MNRLWKLVDNLENWLCQLLLVTFVALLFAQIMLRNLFSYSLPWADELATYAFVWFAYLGAVYAAKKSAHNRVTFQFRFFPRWVELACGALTDLIWIAFNLVFIWLSYDFVFNKMNTFWKSQTLGIPMKVFYLILPLAFVFFFFILPMLRGGRRRRRFGNAVGDIILWEVGSAIARSAFDGDGGGGGWGGGGGGFGGGFSGGGGSFGGGGASWGW